VPKPCCFDAYHLPCVLDGNPPPLPPFFIVTGEGIWSIKLV